MRRNGLILGLVIAASASLGFVAGAADKKEGAMWTPAEMKWVELAPNAGLQKVALWGDRDKGPEYAMLLKLPPGTNAGMHAHSKDYYAVAVQGDWWHTFDGGEAKQLPVGSYVFQPGKTMHNDECRGTVDCIIFIHQHGKGDFIPGPPAAPK